MKNLFQIGRFPAIGLIIVVELKSLVLPLSAFDLGYPWNG